MRIRNIIVIIAVLVATSIRFNNYTNQSSDSGTTRQEAGNFAAFPGVDPAPANFIPLRNADIPVSKDPDAQVNDVRTENSATPTETGSTKVSAADKEAWANGKLTKQESKDYANATPVTFSELISSLGSSVSAKLIVMPARGELFLTDTAKSGAHLVAFYNPLNEQQIINAATAAEVDTRYLNVAERSSNPYSSWILFAVFIVIMFFTFRSLRKGNMPGAGTAPEALKEGAIPSTRFSDVAGIDEAVDELQEIVEFLKAPERFEATGAKMARGAVLIGPPGTGKTLLARAVAGEAGVPFFSVSGSDFVEQYVGVGARRVRELFANARKSERAIVFIDELDSVARRRSSQGEAADLESDRTLNALLVELDGFAGSNVIVLAATNRVDVLDEAIIRPGRLERKITVPAPDRGGRTEIFKVHMRGKPIDSSVDPVALARRTAGMTGAEIAAVVNEACLTAAREHVSIVDNACFDTAVATVMMGRARTSAIVSDHDRLITAWHEAGHTVCALVQADADDPVSVSIVPRGTAGGVTWMTQSDDMFLTRRRAHGRLVTSLGGRAAEMILLDGEFTQGAHGDLETATNLATAMATKYGMTRLGLMVRNDHTVLTGGVVASEVHDVIEEILQDALIEASRVLESERELVEAIVKELLDKETLTQADIVALHEAHGANRNIRNLPPVPPRKIYRPRDQDGYVEAPVTERVGAEPRVRVAVVSTLSALTDLLHVLARNRGIGPKRRERQAKK